MSEVIGIIGAMDEEIELMLKEIKDSKTVVKAGISYHVGTIFDKSVVLCRSGIGKVNAAVTTQILHDSFGVSKVLFTGVAGAVHPDLNIGDIVISSECMQHDMDVTPLGYQKGIIPDQEVSSFPADAGLIALAEKSCRELKCHYEIGKVLSGDQFIASREVVASLRQEMDGACVEMEGAAVAQVCFMNNTPFVVIRSMSDRADGSAEVNYKEFTIEASQRSHAILAQMLQAL
ncbi:5'-methylthioadenosine/S-adenosylhomocysteine nucleosidase [Bacillus sp. FJAT-27264]|uniref:5'-methylthioadenosine/adenosylhomocysteine nucleosidase n=1 Tax=Paenibacillus sp. (strain DSM 101736 / FJAT-27264) TaxID=1850362 RepID=UPI0008080DAB|nr:5'-methylthioadenosine/adenosylhomocysteine nucleosidase [Bacillus sp. FJAT-27264]OBZ14566.1 5'-methylthioadenosine/S-adenosylhomocysteine nucleosidase [Bacillus sp. FJAT-27264]